MDDIIKLEVRGESVTYGFRPGQFTADWLYFGIYPEYEAVNIAHNLTACFSVEVRMTNTVTKEVEIYKAPR